MKTNLLRHCAQAARVTLAVAACAAAQNAAAACYQVYDAQGKLLYRSVHSPVDLEPHLHETVPELEPGGATMVFTPDSFDCISGEVNVWKARKEMAKMKKNPPKKSPPMPLQITPAAAPAAPEAGAEAAPPPSPAPQS